VDDIITNALWAIDPIVSAITEIPVCVTLSVPGIMMLIYGLAARQRTKADALDNSDRASPDQTQDHR
jgi:hypothetical protein